MNIAKIKSSNKLKYNEFDLVGVTFDELVNRDEYKLKWLLEHSKGAIDTIVDIGANLGMFAIYCRELFPKARIISLEACKDTFDILVENTRGQSIECYNLALGDGSRLYLNKCPVHSGANQFVRQQADCQSVQSLRLVDIFSRFNITGRVIIKIDIEGGELFLYNDTESSNMLGKAIHSAIEYHSLSIPGFSVSKDEFDGWIVKTFKNHVITGLGGGKSIRGATYTATDKGII